MTAIDAAIISTLADHIEEYKRKDCASKYGSLSYEFVEHEWISLPNGRVGFKPIPGFDYYGCRLKLRVNGKLCDCKIVAYHPDTKEMDFINYDSYSCYDDVIIYSQTKLSTSGDDKGYITILSIDPEGGDIGAPSQSIELPDNKNCGIAFTEKSGERANEFAALIYDLFRMVNDVKREVNILKQTGA